MVRSNFNHLITWLYYSLKYIGEREREMENGEWGCKGKERNGKERNRMVRPENGIEWNEKEKLM